MSSLSFLLTGVENPGHPTITTVGMVAGDVESYEVFKELFDPVIDERHGGHGPDAKHTSDMDVSKVDTSMWEDWMDSYVRSTRVRTGRSLSGIPLPPACNKEERRKIEAILTKALTNLEGDLAGDYFPLAGSESYEPKKGGMTAEEEEELRKDHFLFQEPDSTLLISGAMHRDWPDARGIFHNKDKNALVWLNEEDHMRIISMEMGADLKRVFERFVNLTNAVEKVVIAEGSSFAHSDHLGYILTCPSNLGTGLRASMMVSLPNIGKRPDFVQLCSKHRLQPRGSAGVDSAFDGTFDISNSDRLGKSEVELVNLMIKGVAELLTLEKAAADAKAIVSTALKNVMPPSSTQFRSDPKMDPYCSWEAVEAAKKEFLAKPPYEIDVNGVTIKLHHNPKGATEHSNCMVKHLTEDIYNRLKDKATPNGISLDKCIQTGTQFLSS